jgi:hypothetical protein
MTLALDLNPCKRARERFISPQLACSIIRDGNSFGSPPSNPLSSCEGRRLNSMPQLKSPIEDCQSYIIFLISAQGSNSTITHPTFFNVSAGVVIGRPLMPT